MLIRYFFKQPSRKCYFTGLTPAVSIVVAKVKIAAGIISLAKRAEAWVYWHGYRITLACARGFPQG